MGHKQYKLLSSEEKSAAVARYLGGEGSASKLARELGVACSTLTSWIRKSAGEKAPFNDPGRPRGSNYDINKYRRMLAETRRENEALKQENERLKAG